MSDILKVSAPMLKSTPQIQRNVPDPTIPFQIKDVSKVNNLNQAKETNRQGQTLVSGDGPTLLLQMLNDPLGSIQFIKSMFMLQEVASMLPLANKVITKEIEKLLDDLLLKPEDLVNELLLQEMGSSLFQGELFDKLRGFLKQYPQHQMEVINLLKHLNGQLQKDNYVDSVLSNLSYLSEKFSGLQLGEKIDELIMRFDSVRDYHAIHDDLEAILKEIENSILFSPKMEKNISILKYNVSRLLPSVDQEYMLSGFDEILDLKSYLELKGLLKMFVDNFDNSIIARNNNKVMQILTKLIEVQIANKDELGMGQDKFEKIIYSLLASPSNFTPLMHFILPLDFKGLQSFAELWVDPNPNEESIDSPSKMYQMLLAIEVDGLGHFEVDIQLIDQKLNLKIFTPANLLEPFSKFSDNFKSIVYKSSYRLDKFDMVALDNPRTLMEVFKRLANRRSGVNIYA